MAKIYEVVTVNAEAIEFSGITRIGYDEVSRAYGLYSANGEDNEILVAIFPEDKIVCIRLIKEAE